MSIIVQKFGGTSVADLDKIKNVSNIVHTEVKNGNLPVVVVSAMAGVTSSLIAKSNNISKLSDSNHLREYDALLSSGELVTASLMAMQLQNLGLKSVSLQGWQIPIITDDCHGNANIIKVDSKKIRSLISSNIIPVITGFQGITTDDQVTTLGLGGSDTSAAIIAAAVNADRCDIYTDVEAVYSADPRIVHDAKMIKHIHIDELCAMCSSGAKLLHPRAAVAAKRYNFDLRILSSFSKKSGTIITHEKNIMEDRLITAITSNKNLLKVTIEISDINEIIKLFAKEKIIIEQLVNYSAGKYDVITSLHDRNIVKQILDAAKKHNKLLNYDFKTDISSLTVVGYGIKNSRDVVYEIFEILANNGIDVISSQLSDLKFSLIIKDDNNEKAIKLIHDHFLNN